MTEFAIKTRRYGTLTFFMPSKGGYVRLETAGKSGTLSKHICDGGGFMGYMLGATPETLEKVARGWHRQRLDVLADNNEWERYA
jgi:hypothetical protein